ncbi:hypothetical protein WH243_01320 [Acinetobacter sp. MYb177]|jgi:hypothetical protein|uniref:hypothetical protein n=1 Tax=unclassified Acinetobacter TaxID=196816 RepID=UPI0030AB1318
MNNHPLLQYLSITSKHLLWQFSNSGTLGIPEALKNSANEIYLQSKLSNEALYYLQVKTFLETLDLEENDVEQFMSENSDHQRLGLELFKVLENTSLEKQACMLAKAFKAFLSRKCDKDEYDKYVYIICRLDNHLIKLIETMFNKGYDHSEIEPSFEKDGLIIQVGKTHSSYFFKPNLELLNFDFLETEKLNHTLQNQEVKYIRTLFFLHFYENIIL